MPAARRESARERRSAIRHKISVPLKHRVWKSSMSEQSALAVDISERGIQFVTDCFYPDGEIVELRFEMPEAVAGESPSEWLCTGHVVRVRRIGTTTKMKIGVQFDCYEVTAIEGYDNSSTSFSIPRTGEKRTTETVDHASNGPIILASRSMLNR